MEQDLVAYIQAVYQIKQNEVYDYMKSKSKRLRKIRNIYWFEVLEIKEGISKLKLTEKIKKEFKNYDEFKKGVLS